MYTIDGKFNDVVGRTEVFLVLQGANASTTH